MKVPVIPTYVMATRLKGCRAKRPILSILLSSGRALVGQKEKQDKWEMMTILLSSFIHYCL